MNLQPGSKIGPFEIVAPLGAGGMGEVYRARDTRLGRDVAVKILPEKFDTGPEARARFEREAKAVAALSHPNILALHDFGVENGIAYSVTELLEGGTLRERMAGSPLPLRKALDYAAQIARGLAAAHERGIYHRDLKPDNLFVTNDGLVKILDFGLAKIATPEQSSLTASPTLEAGTQPGTVLGTLGYMSPEQVRGQPADHRADIFAFGSILHEMLAGRPAFVRATAADTMSAILKEDAAPLAESNPDSVAPPALQGIIHHCLEKNPAERFQSARDLAFNVEAVSSVSGSGFGQATSGAGGFAPAPAEAAAVSTRRTWVMLAGGVVAGIAIGALAATAMLQRPAPEPPTLRYLTYSGVDTEPAASPDGRLVAYASERDGNGQIWIKQYPGGDEAALTTGPDDSRPRISPDGSYVLFNRIEGERPSLYRVPVVGGEPRKVIDDAYDGDWSPDGEQIVFVRENRENELGSVDIGVIEVSGRESRLLATVENVRLDFPRWSPDGSTIAIAQAGSENSPNTILLVDVTSGALRHLTPPPPAGLLSASAWSGSGEALVYVMADTFITGAVGSTSGRVIRQEVASGRARNLMWLPSSSDAIDIFAPGAILIGERTLRQNLIEFALDGRSSPATDKRWLTHGNSIDRQPALSPDGEWAIFSSNRSGNLDLYKVSTSSGSIRRITEDAADDWDPAFTPDGRRIVWSSSRGGHFEIWICDADGTGARQLTNDGLDAENPTATPDSEWIIYNSTNPKAPGIWKIRIDGSDATLIMPGTWSTPEVSPDGAWVATRTGTQPRALRIARIRDGEMQPFPIALPGGNQNGRPRWLPDGKAIAFIATNEAGVRGISVQDFSPGRDTTATRRPLIEFDVNTDVESFGIAPDGTHVIFSIPEEINSLMLAEGLPGIEPPRWKR